MRILWLSDSISIYCSTGYASTGRDMCLGLREKGHKIITIGFNIYGQNGIHSWNDFPILPNYLANVRDQIYGSNELIIDYYNRFKAQNESFDVLIFHNDFYRHAEWTRLPEEIKEKSVWWLPSDNPEPDTWLEHLRQIKHLVFITKFGLDLHKDKLIYPSIYIPHAVDIEAFKPLNIKKQLKEKKGWEGKFILVRIDRNQPRKRYPLLLELFAQFAKGKDDVVLYLKCNPHDCVGTDLEKQVNELEIQNKVIFNDTFYSPEDLNKEFYQVSDVFVTTSAGEGFGKGVAEAISAGIPVLAPKTTTFPELLEDGKNGELVDIKSLDFLEGRNDVKYHTISKKSFILKMNKMYENWKCGNSNVLEEMGKSGRQCAEREYSFKSIMNKWDKYLKENFNQQIKIQEKEFKNILIFLPLALGDIVMSTVILKVLKQKYSKAKITYFTSPYFSEILRNNSNIDNIIEMSYAEFASKKEVLEKQYDRVFYLGGYGNERGEFVSANVKSLPNENEFKDMHFIKYIAYQCGVNLLDIKMEIFPTIHNKIRVDNILKNIESTDEQYIVISHRTSEKNKNWSLENFIELIKKIRQQFSQYKIIILGGAWDPCISYEGVYNMLGMDLLDVAEIIKRCKFFIGPDTGLTHIASSFNKNALAICLGDKPLSKTCPLGDNTTLIATKSVGGLEDIITVDKVWNEFLKKSQKEIKEMVSIIIPSYNRFDFLKKEIESILKFTNDEFYEIIIIDNNSNKEVKDYLKTLENNKFISVIYNSENLGAPAARNIGLKKAKGEYILFFDDDVLVLDKGWLKQVKDFFKSHNDIGAAGGIMLREEGFNFGFLSSCVLFFKKSLIDEIGYMDERFSHLPYTWGFDDIDFSFRILKKGYKLYQLGHFNEKEIYSIPLYHPGMPEKDRKNTEEQEKKRKLLEKTRKIFLNKWKDENILNIKPKKICIMIVKNEEDIIEDFFNKNEKFFDYFIVMDNGSTDKTFEICKKYDKIVELWKDESVFQCSMRVKLLERAQKHINENDWVFIWAPDMFLNEDPSQHIEAALKEEANAINYNIAQFYYTKEDFTNRENEDYSKSILERRLSYSINFQYILAFKNQKGVTWLKSSEPYYIPNIKVLSKNPIIRHYQYRNIEQIQRRLQIRKEAKERGCKSFTHCYSWDYKDYIIDENKLCKFDNNWDFSKIINPMTLR